MNKTAVVLGCVVLLSLVVNVSAVSWDNGNGDRLWSNPVNWNPNGLPTILVEVAIGGTDGPIINSPTTATGLRIRVGGRQWGQSNYEQRYAERRRLADDRC